ncbi:MAG: hypothetical protein MUC36_17475 [Planctomycetes bacterium]|nr:hypothetical protein [Planctomycetota bacterium]
MRAIAVTFACLCSIVLLPAQQVQLPGATGKLVPAAGWTVLQANELAAPSRASDPAAEPARTMLLAMVGELQQQKRTAEHVLLHQLGAGDALRCINAWSVPGSATAKALLQADAVAQVREAMLTSLAAAGAKVAFAGHDDPKLFGNGSLRLRFSLQQGERHWLLQHHVVPAGDRVQYFETVALPGDAGAADAFAAVLRTFDGAVDGTPPSTLTNMVLGGVCGGLAGIATAMWRRRRLQRAAQR